MSGIDIRLAAAETWPEFDWPAAELESGAFHDVLVLPDVAVAKITRAEFTANRLPRVVNALRTVAGADLPARVAVPLSEPVRWNDSHAAVLLSFVSGVEIASIDQERLGRLGQLFDSFERVRPDVLIDLPPARDWCGGDQWPRIVRGLTSELPGDLRRAAERAVDEVVALEGDLCLSHGDLTQYNLRWSPQEPPGIIDWDHVSAGGLAIDVGCLLGTVPAKTLAEVVSDSLMDAARVHKRTFPLQIAAAGWLCHDSNLRETGLRNFTSREAAAGPAS